MNHFACPGGSVGPLLVIILNKLWYWIEFVGGKEIIIEEIRDGFLRIEALLRDTEGRGETHILSRWRIEGRELCCDIQELIDKISSHLTYSQEAGFLGCLSKYGHNIANTCSLCIIVEEIIELSSKIDRVETALTNLSARGSSLAPGGRLENRHVAAPIIAQATLVGMEEPQKRLFELLVTGGKQPQLTVIAVTGESGVGKTILARNVFEDRRAKACFDCHAWVPADGTPAGKQLLIKAVSLLYGETNTRLPEGVDKMEIEQLTDLIKRYLEGKRYVIVFDDLNRRDGLKFFLENALPKDNHARVIVTTRIRDFGAPSSHVIDLQPLSREEARELFCRRIFGSEVCPPDLENLTTEITKLCGRLPFVISVISGLLSSREKNEREWRSFYSDLDRRGKVPVVTAVLATSINELPEHLKNCLLCFSIFPRGRAVASTNLFRVWIAEGFIKEEAGRTSEEVAYGYLTELTDRSIVQVAEYYDYGRIRSCKVHDLIHQALTAIAEEDNFSTISMRHSVQSYRKIRRLSVHDTEEEIPPTVSFSKLRSLFIFRPISQMPKIFPSKRSLRALSLEGTRIDKFPEEIASLIYLRYLNLRNTKITKLPKPLKNLQCLQTLDLKGTYLTRLPKAILKLKNLRHLLAYHYDARDQPPLICGVKVPKGMQKLKELQTLSVVDADGNSGIVEELKHLIQLRRLGIVNLREKDELNLLVAISRMVHLSSVSVTSADNMSLRLQDWEAAPPCLQRLYLRGKLAILPPCLHSLHSLVRLRLRGSKLGEDILEVLQNLENLADLSLIQAYDGKQLSCRGGGFPRLKILDLDQLDGLVEVKVEGAMPHLSKMIIRNCGKLEAVPVGINGLIELKELHLFEMPEKFLSKVKSGGEDCDMVRHVEYVCYYEKGVPRKIILRDPDNRTGEDIATSRDPADKGKRIAYEAPKKKKEKSEEGIKEVSLETLTQEFLAIVAEFKKQDIEISDAAVAVGLPNLEEAFKSNPGSFAGRALSPQEVLIFLRLSGTGASSSSTVPPQ